MRILFIRMLSDMNKSKWIITAWVASKRALTCQWRRACKTTSAKWFKRVSICLRTKSIIYLSIESLISKRELRYWRRDFTIISNSRSRCPKKRANIPQSSTLIPKAFRVRPRINWFLQKARQTTNNKKVHLQNISTAPNSQILNKAPSPINDQPVGFLPRPKITSQSYDCIGWVQSRASWICLWEPLITTRNLNIRSRPTRAGQSWRARAFHRRRITITKFSAGHLRPGTRVVQRIIWGCQIKRFVFPNTRPACTRTILQNTSPPSCVATIRWKTSMMNSSSPSTWRFPKCGTPTTGPSQPKTNQS